MGPLFHFWNMLFSTLGGLGPETGAQLDLCKDCEHSSKKHRYFHVGPALVGKSWMAAREPGQKVGKGAKWVPLRVPVSSSFERCWSHWPCRSSLSQGQYSPSTAGGARHPQTASRIPQGDKWRDKGSERRKENREHSYLQWQDSSILSLPTQV